MLWHLKLNSEISGQLSTNTFSKQWQTLLCADTLDTPSQAMISHQPINNFITNSKVVWAGILVKIYPNWRRVSIAITWIFLAIMFSPNHTVLIAECLLRGVNWGGRVVASIKAPELSSWIVTCIVGLSGLGIPTASTISVTRSMIGKSSLQQLPIGAALIKKYSSYRTKLKKVPRVFSPKP